MELERHGLKVVLRKTDNFLPGRRRLSAVRPRRPDPQGNRAAPQAPTPRPTTATSPSWRRSSRCSRNGCCGRRPKSGAGISAIPEAAEPRPRHGRPVARRNADRPRIRDRAARPTSSTAISRATSPRPCSGSTAWSAISPRRTRRARPTSCSTICSARRPAFPAPGAMRSAAWARSPRRWRAACREAGVDIVLDTPVEEVIVDEGPRGRAWSPAARRGARKASSPASIRSCCSTGWCRKARSTPMSPARMHGWKCESATFRMNVALSELPKFTVLPKKGNHLTAGIIMAPSLDYMHRA